MQEQQLIRTKVASIDEKKVMEDLTQAIHDSISAVINENIIFEDKLPTEQASLIMNAILSVVVTLHLSFMDDPYNVNARRQLLVMINKKIDEALKVLRESEN